MTPFSATLLVAAAGIGITHTILGPDHYLPFLVLARARGWTMRRALLVTACCGLGHVASSVALGLVGLAAGVAVGRITGVEEGRGDWAAWALIAFGAAYGAWGVRRAIRARADMSPHAHGGRVHIHAHGSATHVHGHGLGTNMTFWALFIAFVLGPCEPLIPLFLLPASRGEFSAAVLTAVVFGLATIGTMVGVTALGLAGLARVSMGPLERWSHAMAGGVVAASGLAIITLGL